MIGATNRYIVTREPWVLAKDPAQADGARHGAVSSPRDTVRVIAELLRPFMPATGERTLRMLGHRAVRRRLAIVDGAVR